VARHAASVAYLSSAGDTRGAGLAERYDIPLLEADRETMLAGARSLRRTIRHPLLAAVPCVAACRAAMRLVAQPTDGVGCDRATPHRRLLVAAR